VRVPSINFKRIYNFTRKKLKLSAIQIDNFIRAQFIIDVSLYTRDILVFIDETGTDCRDKEWYSLRGMPARAQKLLARGEHISVISAMSVDVILCYKIVRGGVNGETFIDFIENNLIPV